MSKATDLSHLNDLTDLEGITDGTNGQVLTTDGSGSFSFQDASGGISDIVGDTTPQLGGDLDLNSSDITGTGNINVTGSITLSGTVDSRDVAADGTKLDTVATNADVTPSWVPSSDPSYLTSYTVTSGDVTAHEGDITITESQISDLGSYLTSVPAQSFASLTGKPTTISGYGITDALAIGTTATTALAGNTSLFSGAYADLTGTPTLPTDFVSAASGGTFSGNVTMTSDLTVDTDTLYVDSTNNRVGIGESNPDGLLHLTGDTNSNGAELYLQVNNNNTTDNLGAIHFGNNVDSTLSMIRGSSAAANNSSYLSFYNSATGTQTERMRLETDGDLHVDGNVVAYSTTVSDIRLKKDIAPIDNAVTKVQQLNGCTFTYLKDDRKSAGLIAQDVEKVLPSAVIEDKPVFHGEEGETYKTVQYDQVIGLLVEAVKELSSKVEELEKKLGE